jgi:hypothetical protein
MRKVFILLFSAVLFISCEKDALFFWDGMKGIENDSSYIYASSSVFDVIAPASVKYGESINIQVRHTGNSGCAGFSHFHESPTGKNAINIRVIQKEPREDFCASVLTTLTSSYEFTPTARQKYIFNFWRGELYENDFITVYVNVR